jgi:NADPH:quinone reductase-like Zn-dependent oxidoreductase
MPERIPETMRAVVLEEYHADLNAAIRSLTVRERPVAAPRKGQVLVRIEAAPCNPSDLLLLQGKYGTLKSLPTVPGWEGAGTVVASGGGLYARWLVGKRVACALKSGNRDGTWAEYFVAGASDCIPIKPAVPIEQAASFIINPMTAVALLESARRAGHVAAVHTAGASQLGRMMLSAAAEMNYPLINLVRRAAQAEMLKSRGARHVIDTSRDGFVDELKRLSAELRATAAFEAIAGDMTGIVLNALPPKSTVYLYGALSESPCAAIDPIEVVFHDKSLRGFFLGNWMDERGVLGVVRTASKVQRMIIDGRIETAVQRRLALDEAVEGLSQYVANMTDGKVLFTPHGKPSDKR